MLVLVKFLSFFLFSYSTFARCDFKKEIKYVTSFSGSMTVLLKELNLLSHPKLKGISVFAPVGQNEFKGAWHPGGLFLSHKSLMTLHGHTVFYDEARELRRLFYSVEEISSYEVKTRNLSPVEAIESTLKVLSPFVTGCDERMISLKKKALKIQDSLASKIPKGLKVIFYLGEFSGDRRPEMVVANDGVVKWLREKKLISTYPSELSYVNWSSKVMQELPKNVLHVGIKDSGSLLQKEIKRSSQKMTLIYPGALIPGLSQLEAFLFLAEGL